jgi:hypothetical protein
MRLTWLGVATILCACGSVTKQPDAAIDAPALGQITGITPTKGIVTVAATITGTGFGTEPGTVKVGGVAATVTSWSDTSIAIKIPDVMPGDADVVVTTAGGMSAPMTFTVVLPPTIYIDNGQSGTDGFDSVSALAFDPATGAVTQIGQPVSMGVAASGYGGCSTSLWINTPTRHLFASGSGKFAVFNINPVSGALTPVAGSPFDAGGGRSFSVLTNAAGNRLWIDNFGSTNVGVFDLAADGTPTPVAGSPFASPFASDTMTLSKDETILYVNYYGGAFSGFTVASTGAMTPLTTQTAGGGTGIMRRPGTDQLFVPTESNTFGVFTAASDGTVTQLTGSPFMAAAPGPTLQVGAFTADGSRLYFADFGRAAIVGFDLAADGTPTAITGSPWTFGTTSFSSCAAVAQDGSYLIATNTGASSVGVFALDATGTPTLAAGSPFSFMPANTSANGLAITF